MTEEQFEAIVALLRSIDAKLSSAGPSARPAGVAKPTPRRAEALAEHDAKWNSIRERWPKLSIEPRAMATFERDCALLEGEPDDERLRRWMKSLAPSKIWTRPRIEERFQTDREMATAIINFLKWSGYAIWDSGGITLTKKGRTAREES